MRSRDEVKKKIEKALRAEFPQDTVDISDGYGTNIHVMVVSRRFDSMSSTEQVDLMWSAVDKVGLKDTEKQLISLVLPLSPDDIK